MKTTPFQDWKREQRRIRIIERVIKFAAALVVVGLLVSTLAGCEVSAAKSEETPLVVLWGTGASDVSILQDRENGCQYFIIKRGGTAGPVAVTPRMMGDGQQVGCPLQADKVK